MRHMTASPNRDRLVVHHLFFLATTMTITLRPSPGPSSPFTWDNIPSPGSSTDNESPLQSPPSPPTAWLSASDMKMYGDEPLKHHVGIVKCSDCGKPVLRSAFLDHIGIITMYSRSYRVLILLRADNCTKIRNGGKKGGKAKADAEGLCQWNDRFHELNTYTREIRCL